MNVVLPRPGEGWGRLLSTPEFNGGDEYPPELHAVLDSGIGQVPSVGLTVGSTPSVLFLWHPSPFNPAERMVHWCSDGRTPLKESLNLLDAITHAAPTTRHHAFVRRPALVRLLASRGWQLQARNNDPFMALMVCQRDKSDLT